MWNQVAARENGSNDVLLSLHQRLMQRAHLVVWPGSARLMSLLKILAIFTTFVSPLTARAGFKIASLHCTSDSTAQTDLQKKLLDLKLFDKVDNLDIGSVAPSLATLQQYDSVIVWADSSHGCYDSTNTGNILAQYVDAGGGVVQVLPRYVGNTSSNIGGDFYSRYALVNQGYMTYSYAYPTLGSKLEVHPVLDGVNTLTTSRYGYYRSSLTASELRNGGRIIATWSDGNGLVVVGSPGGHNRVDLNMFLPSSDTSSGSIDAKTDGFRLLGQSLLWVINPLRANPALGDFGDVPFGTTSLPLTVEVRNTGKDPITISGGALSAMGEFDVKLLGGAAYPIALNTGDRIGFEFTVRPTSLGRRQASYNLSVSTPGAPGVSIPLTVNSLGPVIKVNPTQLSFGGMLSGAMPRVQTVTVLNNGGGLLVLRAAPSLSDATNFQIVNPPITPVSLAAGASISFDVKFTPTLEKTYSATLTIPYNDGVDRTTQVQINGSYGKPKISVTTSTIVLTPVRVNAAGPTQGIIVTNTGLADLTISSVSFTGRDPGEFAALTMPSMSMPLVIPPSTSSELKIQCNPTVQGLRQATYNIVSDDPALGTATVALQCNGVFANFDIQPDKIDFPMPQQTGQCSAAQTVTIKNTGTDNLRVLSVSFSGPNASSFSQPITGGRIVASTSGQLQIPVQFCPVDIGAQTADLVVTTDLMAGHTAKVPLTGTATGPKVVVMPGSLDFGPVYINTTSSAKTIQISNDGDQPLVFGKNSLTPPMGPFKVSGLPAEGTKLNKGDPPIVLTVTASPSSMQSMLVSGELSILINDQVKMNNLRIPLAVLGTQAEIMVQPMMLSFPQTIIGATSAPQMITVTNTGRAPLAGIDAVAAGTNATDFVIGPMLPATVDSGQSFQVPVSFRPTGSNARNAVIVIKAAGLMAPVQVKVEGSGKLLTISCTPDSKNFGNLPVGQEKKDKVLCRNSDSSGVEFIASFTDFVDDWSVDPVSGTLDGGSPGGDEGLATLTVTFHPTATGPRTTTLNIKTKDGVLIGTINLDATGTAASTMKQSKDSQEVGCAYSGHSNPPTAFALALLALSGLLLRRRRYA